MTAERERGKAGCSGAVHHTKNKVQKVARESAVSYPEHGDALLECDAEGGSQVLDGLEGILL
jgi:hypothetical protein